MELAIHNGYKTLEVEFDYAVAMNAFHHDCDVSMMESIIQDLRLLCASCSFFLPKFISISCNGCDSALGFFCVFFPSSMLNLAYVALKCFFFI